MATETTIEWADLTWSPMIGCDRVSPGCNSCYAISTARIRESNPHPGIAAAFAGTTHRTDDRVDWTGKVNLLEDRLSPPLAGRAPWHKPRRVFVNSQSDLFHDKVPLDFIARVFAVMALTPQHTYQVLTKRHARMRSVLNDVCTCGLGHIPGVHFRSAMAWAVSKANPNRIPGVPDDAEHRVHAEANWPLPNVWMGVSVEDQKWADIRIPALVDTPAAVRFISAEPLLGPVDLTKWMTPISPINPDRAPTAWANWAWPEWVPAQVRESIEGFWGADQGRSPRHWMRDMHQQGAPAFGATLHMDDGFGLNPRQVVGRYVHAWNNIGRLVLANDPDRSFAYTSFGHKDRQRSQPINWVIAGGESGPKARPMHPDWARSLRNQCVDADVPFLFKQFGQWGLEAPLDADGRILPGRRGLGMALANDGTLYAPGDLSYPDGPRYGEAIRKHHDKANLHAVYAVGKKAAGRELDGRTWDQFPTPKGA